MEKMVEYGVLGICVAALSVTVYRFVLVRMSDENTSLRREVQEIRTNYDKLLSQQLTDYQHTVQMMAEISAKGRAAIQAATETMGLVLAHLSKGEEEKDYGDG